MKKRIVALSTALLFAAGLGAGWRATAASPAPDARTLAREAAVLAQEVQLLEDQHDLENLQRIYGFYVDKHMWTQVADLFTEDGTLEIGGRGVFKGKARVAEYLHVLGSEGPQDGLLYDHTQMQPIVDVAPDGRTAKARWRAFIQVGQWHGQSRWGMGIYENDYVKEDGVWKIDHLHAYFVMYTPYDKGWGVEAQPNTKPGDKLAPDAPPSVPHETYPTIFVPPFHYENPVTGQPVYQQTAADFAVQPAADVSLDDVSAMLDTVEHQLGLEEDVTAIERLHSVYGYYLARNQWDDLANIFADDGTIEIALRGRYVGHDSIRRNLNLYGDQGISPGFLHHHMQYQGVIDVADDGQTAKMRSRAFSMMGQYGQYAQFMGGVYENDYVKEDGIWKLKVDHVINSYFVTYDGGWTNAVPRAAPGITESNPPDLPPSMHFEMFPKNFLVPFHYNNPVTGKPSVLPEQAGAR